MNQEEEDKNLILDIMLKDADGNKAKITKITIKDGLVIYTQSENQEKLGTFTKINLNYEEVDRIN